MQVRERQILQFAVNIVQAQPVRDRHVHFHRFGGDAALLGRRHVVERAHIVQAVGQLDQDHAHVRGHRQQHLAEIFRLRFDQALKLDFFQLRQAVHQVGDGGAEALDQLFLLDVLVFHDVVQEGGHDGLGVELPFGADFGDGDGVDDVRFARFTDLPKMHFVGEAVGFLDFFQLGRGEVFGKARDQMGHRGNCRCRSGGCFLPGCRPCRPRGWRRRRAGMGSFRCVQTHINQSAAVEKEDPSRIPD